MNIKYYKYIIWLVVVLLINSLTIAQINENPHLKNTNKKLYLLSPKGTEILEQGSEVKINWDFRNIDKILIEYSTDDIEWKIITHGVEAVYGSYIWTIDSKIKKQFKIRITDKSDFNIFDVTPFYILVRSSINNYNEVNNFLKKTSTSSTLKIMPLGNSITLGVEEPAPPILNGYRKTLKENLDNNGLNLDFVGSLEEGSFTDNQHEGHGGWHAKHWSGNLNYDLLSHLHSYLEMNPPDIILLHIGTNDIGEYYISWNDNTVDTTVTNVSSLLDTIYNFNPNIKVILAKIINREDNATTTTVNESTETTAFNNALEIMANNRIANEDNLSLVDMESVLNYSSDLSDGVHPNEVGYTKMAEAWYSAIVNVLPKSFVKIFLEGNYIGSEQMSSSLNTAGVIPLNQPFNQLPWNYNGTENVDQIPFGVVDWVLVSLRTNSTESSTVAQRAGFLKTDGTILDLDGTNPLAFVVDDGNYHIIVEHRNHLPVMSAGKVLIEM